MISINLYGGKFDDDSKFEVKICFLPTHFREKRFLKKMHERIRKNFIFLNSRVNYDSE